MSCALISILVPPFEAPEGVSFSVARGSVLLTLYRRVVYTAASFTGDARDAPAECTAHADASAVGAAAARIAAVRRVIDAGADLTGNASDTSAERPLFDTCPAVRIADARCRGDKLYKRPPPSR
jgi:hypothetical protein